MAKARVWKIVVNDFAKAGTFFGHGPCATLAEPDTVPLANAIENDPGPAFLCRESVARHRVPAEAAIHGQPPSFMMIGKNHRILK